MKSTLLEEANKAFSNGDFEIALALYNKLIQENKTLSFASKCRISKRKIP